MLRHGVGRPARQPSFLGCLLLAWLLATCAVEGLRDGKKAVELATKACELAESKDPRMITTLAAALAESGEFDRAVEKEREAIRLTTDPAQKHWEQSRLEYYLNKQPYHETLMSEKQW